MREFRLRDADFAYLTRRVGDKTGIVLGDEKRDMVYARLAKRLRRLGMRDFGQYVDLLERSGDGDGELIRLVNALTTNLTHFFREKHHFDHLRNDALPEIAARANAAGRHRLRLWSAGCSSGMEPYSIAMVLRETIPRIDAWDARVLATDIDTDMLETGRKGVYRQRDTDGIPDGLRKKYLSPTPTDDAMGEPLVRLPATLKKLIAFKHLNLLEPWPMKGPFDAIFCRNVVIYFDKPTQARLFERYAGMLRPDGLLYIGHSESLFNVTNRFNLIGKTIYRRVR